MIHTRQARIGCLSLFLVLVFGGVGVLPADAPEAIGALEEVSSTLGVSSATDSVRLSYGGGRIIGSALETPVPFEISTDGTFAFRLVPALPIPDTTEPEEIQPPQEPDLLGFPEEPAAPVRYFDGSSEGDLGGFLIIAGGLVGGGLLGVVAGELGLGYAWDSWLGNAAIGGGIGTGIATIAVVSVNGDRTTAYNDETEAYNAEVAQIESSNADLMAEWQSEVERVAEENQQLRRAHDEALQTAAEHRAANRHRNYIEATNTETGEVEVIWLDLVDVIDW